MVGYRGLCTLGERLIKHEDVKDSDYPVWCPLPDYGKCKDCHWWGENLFDEWEDTTDKESNKAFSLRNCICPEFGFLGTGTLMATTIV